MRKMLSLFLAISILFSTCFIIRVNAEEQYSEKSYKDFSYIVNEDNEITITKYTGSSKSVKIPSEIDEKKVTVIGPEAFYKNKTLEKITIKGNVRKIEYGAFSRCINIKTVILDEKYTI